MKQAVSLFLLTAIFLTMAFGIQSSSFAHEDPNDPIKSSFPSRFKIFTAEHEVITRTGKIDKVQSIFKIDLETGTVWRYRQGVDQKGKPFEEFFEVPNQ